jgi:DNA-directed RNA polymerase specialized sigma24 family protein
MFVLHKRTVASYCFAVASFAVNMSYYSMHGVELWQLSAFPAWLLSALLPTAIASYSHILNGATESATRTTHFMQWWRRLYALQWWRQSATQTSQPEVQNDATQNPVQHTTAPDDATDSTTDARAQALAMHANQMSASEIARLLQQKESTVRSWIRRGSTIAHHKNGHKEVA